MAYSSSVIANIFILWAKDEGISVTNMSLQKLAYIAHGFYLAKYPTRLIEDDINAFPYGPVIPVLYNRLKRYRAAPVKDPIPTLKPRPLDDSTVLTVIGDVWNGYKHFDGIKLSSITHQPNTPWSITWEKNPLGVIPDEVIRDHYRKLLNDRSGIKPR